MGLIKILIVASDSICVDLSNFLSKCSEKKIFVEEDHARIVEKVVEL